MPFIAHILNVVTKKFVVFQQLGNIVRGIWPPAERVMSTNQCLNFGHSMAAKTTQLIQHLLCFWSPLPFILCSVCKTKCSLYKPQIHLVFQQHLGPVDPLYTQVLLPIYSKPLLSFYPIPWGCALAMS